MEIVILAVMRERSRPVFSRVWWNAKHFNSDERVNDLQMSIKWRQGEFPDLTESLASLHLV